MKKTSKRWSLGLLLMAALLLCACGEKPQPAQSVDLQKVYEEIGNRVELPNMIELSEKRLLNYYGIDAQACPQALARINEAGLSVDEIWLIEAADASVAEGIAEIARSRITQLCAETEKYSPELYAVAQKGQVLHEGAYVALFISPEAETMAQIFREVAGK